MGSADMLPNGSDEQPLNGFTAPFTPRYAEHFVGAAALIGAFGLVFAAMALGAWLLFKTTLVQFKFVREIAGQGSPKKQNQAQIQHEIAQLRRSHSRSAGQRSSNTQLPLQRRSSLGRSGSLGPPIASAHLRRPPAHASPSQPTPS